MRYVVWKKKRIDTLTRDELLAIILELIDDNEAIHKTAVKILSDAIVSSNAHKVTKYQVRNTQCEINS
jgi:hypothetical protein